MEDYVTMAKIISKKRIAAGLFALSAGLVLASCDPVVATPTNYTSPIVMNKDGSEVDLSQFLKGEGIDENIIGKIYDSITSEKNSKVVDQLLKVISDKMYGSYAEILKAQSNADARTAYIAAHKDTFNPDDNAEMAAARFDNFAKDIKERISEAFYNEIISGSYNDDEGRFDEKKFYMAHYYEFYDIEFTGENKFFVTNELTRKNALESLTGTYYIEEGKTGRGYIDEKIFPQVIKDKMVEEYILKNNAGALGRAYARKVQYIKVSYDNDVLPTHLMREYAKEYIESPSAVSAENTALDFTVLGNTLKGWHDVDEETGTVTPVAVKSGDTYAEAYPELTLMMNTLGYNTDAQIKAEIFNEKSKVFVTLKKDVSYDGFNLPANGVYFKESKLGAWIDSYNKAQDAIADGRFAASEDKTELDKLTANNKSCEFNLRKEVISIAKQEYTTEGWFVKNGGLSELPSELRDRLFNINVAHVLDTNDGVRYEDSTVTDDKYLKEADANGHYKLGAYEYGNEKNRNRTPYLRNVNGKKFVIPADVVSYEKDKYNYIYQDVNNKAFYIVQVFEAPSTTKLNTENEDSYAKVYPTDKFKTEEIQRAVAKVLGTKDTYIKDAYFDYLDQFTYEYYDTSFRDYFQGEYPDLFPDND